MKTIFIRSVSCILLILLMASFALPAAAATKSPYVAADGYEQAVFGMDSDILNVSQGLHSGNAIDISGKDKNAEWMLAPFSCVVKRVYASANCHAIFFESSAPVHLANGQSSYVTMLLIHMDDISSFKTGQRFTQYERFYKEGNFGSETNYSFGNHIHIEFGLGKYTGWKQISARDWSLKNSVDPTKVLFLAPGTTVKKDGGLRWKQLTAANTETKLQTEPCFGLGKVTAVNGSKTAPAHTGPYGDSAIVKRYQKGSELLLTAIVTNEAGNLWYKTADGSYIYSEYVTVDPLKTMGMTTANLSLKSGKTYTLTSASNGLYLTLKAQNKAAASMGKGKTDTAFKLVYEKEYCRWRLAPSGSSTQSLNGYADAPKNGTKLVSYKNCSDPTQRFVFETQGRYYVIRLASDPSLVVTALSNGSVQLKTYRGDKSQLWRIQ